MKNMLAFLVSAFTVLCITCGYGAEDQAAAGQQADVASSTSQATLQALRAKTGQARAVLSEIQDLLIQETKILNKILEQKDQAKKNKAAFEEYDRMADGIKQEIQQARDQAKEAEKELATYTRQNEHFSRLQVEFEKAQKESRDSESAARQAETGLTAAQKNLGELKNRVAELTKQADEAKKQSQNLENAKALLETERAKRVEALARAEQTVAMAEKAEKERLILASRLAELEQNASSREKQRKESSEQTDVQGEIEKEKKVIQETEEEISKNEKACEDAENKVLELKKQLQARGKTARGDEKAGDLNGLKASLADVRRQRLAAESRMKDAEAKLRKNERSLEVLSNTLAIAGNQAQRDDESAGLSGRDRIQGEIENEQKALDETRRIIAQKEKTGGEAEKRITELRQQLKGMEKTTSRDVGKEGDLSRLQSRLANVKKQRDAVEERLRESEGSLRESEKTIAGLTNMIAAAGIRAENNRENAQAIIMLTGELERETASLNEVTARVDGQIRNLKALDDEKRRLHESLVVIKEKFGKEAQNTNRLDEIRLQVAGQKKIRTDMETRLEQTTREQEALEKETKQLNQALIAAGNVILDKENDNKSAERLADALRKEQELARNADKLLREKEQTVARLGEDKKALQLKISETEAKLARQNEYVKALDEKRRALEEEKKNRLASDKKNAELARAEKEHKAQIKELESKARAADKESQRLSSRADKTSAEIEAAQTPAAGGSETKETQVAPTAAAGSGKDTIAVEQDILNQARSGGSQPSAAQQPEKKEIKESKQTKSRSRRSKVAEADDHYALAIQKWDEDDLEGAIAEFKNTISLNPDAAGAYYNLSLAFVRQGKKPEACDYAYQAGECYIRIKNLTQATRMAVLITKIDKNSPLIQKLRNKIDAAVR